MLIAKINKKTNEPVIFLDKENFILKNGQYKNKVYINSVRGCLSVKEWRACRKLAKEFFKTDDFILKKYFR